jgi:hypothetical protein
MNNYYNGIIKENQLLNSKINNNLFSDKVNSQAVVDEKAKYLKDTINDMRFINNIMFGIYAFLLAILAYLLYSKTMSLKIKVALFLLVFLYPFYISGLQNNLRFIYNFLFSQTTKVNIPVLPNNTSDSINEHKSMLTDTDSQLNTHEQLLKENSIVDTKIGNLTNGSTTDTRNSLFSVTGTSFYKNLSTALFFVYYICLLGFIYLMFTKIKFNIYVKIAVLVLLGTYPFYADILSKLVIYLLSFLYSIIMVQPYTDPELKYNTSLLNQ